MVNNNNLIPFSRKIEKKSQTIVALKYIRTHIIFAYTYIHVRINMYVVQCCSPFPCMHVHVHVHAYMYIHTCIYIHVLKAVSAGSLGATRLENLTSAAQRMYDYVQNVSDADQCCNYTYQILDKFCGTQPKVSSLIYAYVPTYM